MVSTLVCLTIGVLLGAPSADSPEGRREILDRVEKVLAGLEAVHRGLPRDSFDIAGVIALAGRDPAKLFEWVRDQTSWAPYPGCLRGATGVLLDRTGNSLDRSLLLAELLRAAGHKSRLARAALPEDQAHALLVRVRTGAPAMPTGGEAASAAPAASAEDIALARLTEEAVGRIAARTAELRGACKLAPRDDNAVQREVDAALRDHWWVEVESKGQWAALDPLLPDASPDTALLPAAETFEASSGPRPFALPSAICHEVEVRVVVERLEKGHLSEHQVLSHALRPAEVIGRRVKLFHHPLAWPDNLALGGDPASEDRMKKALLAQKEWLPILEVGRSRISKGSFTDSGDVNENPDLDPRSKLGRGVGRVLGGLGALGGGDDGDGKQQGVLTAEWLDFEIRSPGQPAQKIRRELFDLLGPAARASKSPSLDVTDASRLDRALALFGETEILIHACQLSPELVAHVSSAELLDGRGRFKALASVEDAARWKESVGRLAWEATRPRPLESFALFRAGLSRFTGDVFLDRPNVVTYTRRFGWDTKRGMTAHDIIDVAANHVAVRRGSSADPGLVRLEQGVVDTVAENLALTGGFEDSENTATVFALAEAAGSPPLTLRGADAPLDAAAWPSDVKERIRQDLAAGYTVVVPKDLVPLRGAPHTGWWRVDPATGETIGGMDSGFHADTAEYSENTVITTREQALRRNLEWFQRQNSGGFHSGPHFPSPNYSMGSHWESIKEIETLQQAARALLAQMDFLGLGL